jgi:4-hydroxybenzoyl-CoA reductase subunit beta
MLRLPPFRYHRPGSVAEAVGVLAEYGPEAMPVAGGTDLIPNMKHRLFTPAHLVALKGLEELHGIGIAGDELTVGAAETLTSVATHPQVRLHFSALADAAGHVAGPQLRNSGTIGGNLCLDTRCTYYNQSAFWREALGFCLKKDGDVCHVTKVGTKCVAAHSADTPPVLMTLGAVVDLYGPEGERSVQVRDFFVTDGIFNTVRRPGELVVRIRIPLPGKGYRGAYAKLRQRKSIDFPLLTVAVGATLDDEERVSEIQGVVTALGASPKELTGWTDIAVGERLTDEVIDALAERAHTQCHPLENIIVDPDWRRAMVPVHVRRALGRLRESRSEA